MSRSKLISLVFVASLLGSNESVNCSRAGDVDLLAEVLDQRDVRVRVVFLLHDA